MPTMPALKKTGSDPRKRKEAELVYFEDRGSVVDAPMDVVWDYILKDNDYHPKASD